MSSTRKGLLGVAAVVALLAALVAIAIATDARARFSISGLRDYVADYGAAGVVAYVVAFCIGLLLYVPGNVFLAVAVLTWGRYAGAAIGFVAATLAVTASFTVVRAIGGQPLATMRARWIQRMLARVERQPIRTVLVLRAIVWTSPPLNYAFALSPLRFRDHFIGSMLGLIPAVAIVATFTETVMRLFS